VEETSQGFAILKRIMPNRKRMTVFLELLWSLEFGFSPQSSQRSGRFHTPAVSRAALGTATISPPRSSLQIFIVRTSCRGSTGWRLQFEWTVDSDRIACVSLAERQSPMTQPAEGVAQASCPAVSRTFSLQGGPVNLRRSASPIGRQDTILRYSRTGVLRYVSASNVRINIRVTRTSNTEHRTVELHHPSFSWASG